MSAIVPKPASLSLGALTCVILTQTHPPGRTGAARSTSRGSTIRLALRSGLEDLDPLLGFARAELAGASVPEQSLSRIRSGAAQAGTALKHCIQGRPHLQSSQP